jgi:SAM-dependent methyltransferase
VTLRSPVTGARLAPAGAHVLAAGDERWPVVDGIPFLRTGREALVATVLERLDADDVDGARVALLADADDWWTQPPPPDAELRAAVAAPTLREAMARLGYGPVGDYFAFRWSDPTFLSGLALLDLHAGGARRVFELACGIGHFLRELARRGAAVAGGDVVWSKLWVAKRFVVPEAELVCFDAGAPFPLGDGAADLALCHDALHYLPDKALAARELRRIAPAVVVGHAHNAAVENLSPGDPLDVAGYAALLGDVVLYDDDALARGLVAGAPAAPRPPAELAGSAAVGLALGGAPAGGAFAVPPPGVPLRLNPLLDADGGVRWPSERYETEYAAQSEHLTAPVAPQADPAAAVAALARRRVLVDLPQAW